MEFVTASMRDFDGVKALLRANHVSSLSEGERADGFVTTNLTDAQMEALITKEHGVTVAKDAGGKVLAFALAAPWEFWYDWPLFVHMTRSLGGFRLDGCELTTANSYQYGPVCVDRAARGTGAFEGVFFASLEGMRARFPFMVTFINKVNQRSYAAHTRKAHMTDVGSFGFGDNEYHMMACRTCGA